MDPDVNASNSSVVDIVTRCWCTTCGRSTAPNCLASFEHYNLRGGPFIHDACCACTGDLGRDVTSF